MGIHLLCWIIPIVWKGFTGPHNFIIRAGLSVGTWGGYGSLCAYLETTIRIRKSLLKQAWLVTEMIRVNTLREREEGKA